MQSQQYQVGRYAGLPCHRATINSGDTQNGSGVIVYEGGSNRYEGTWVNGNFQDGIFSALGGMREVYQNGVLQERQSTRPQAQAQNPFPQYQGHPPVINAQNISIFNLQGVHQQVLQPQVQLQQVPQVQPQMQNNVQGRPDDPTRGI